MDYAPVALFVFNRPHHMARTVSALQANDLAPETPLFVYCDGPRHDDDDEHISRVREQAHAIKGFRSVTVVEHDHNLGLSASITGGVSQLCESFGRVIVMEDDLITSCDFLRFMNQGLDLYAHEERVASIHGYAYPIASEGLPETYFLRGGDCWGWATWARAWRHFEPDGATLLCRLEEARLGHCFDYDGYAPYMRMLRNQTRQRNQSWAIRWHASAFLQNMLTLYPRESLVANVGFDDSGVHCTDNDYFSNKIGLAPARLERVRVEENEAARALMSRFFRRVRRQRWIGFLRHPISIGIRQLRKQLKLWRFAK